MHRHIDLIQCEYVPIIIIIIIVVIHITVKLG